jgi:hypothetical protein
VQLEYTDAFRCLQQASRKAPQQSALGWAFRGVSIRTEQQNSDVVLGLAFSGSAKLFTSFRRLYSSCLEKSQIARFSPKRYFCIFTDAGSQILISVQGMIAALKPYLHIAQVALIFRVMMIRMRFLMPDSNRPFVWVTWVLSTKPWQHSATDSRPIKRATLDI